VHKAADPPKATASPQQDMVIFPCMSKAFPMPPASLLPIVASPSATRTISHTEHLAGAQTSATQRTHVFRAHTLPPLSLPPAERRRPPLQPTPPTVPSQPVARNINQKVSEPRKARAGCEITNNEYRPHVLAHNCLRVWSSPFSIEHQHTFGKQLPADIVNRTYTTLMGSYAPGPHDNYAAGLLRFHQFCN
jgi:hypothetical protein